MGHFYDHRGDFVGPQLAQRLDELWFIKKTLQTQHFESYFEKHDNTNLETILTFTEQDYAAKKKEVNRQKYQIDCYLFVPQSLNVQAKGYKARNFFASLTNHIRLKSPDIMPSAFLNLSLTDKPLGALMELKRQILKQSHINLDEQVLEQAKLAASYLMHFLKSLTFKTSFAPNYDIENHYLLEVEFSKIAFRLFRDIIGQFNEVFMHRMPKTLESLNLINEYLSFLIESKWVKVLTLARDSGFELLQGEIETLLREEIKYRRGFCYLEFDSRASTVRNVELERKNETFIHRLGILKKFIQAQLYLQTDYKSISQYVIHSVAMVAALLAAMFAYGVELYQRTRWGYSWTYNAGFLMAISAGAYVVKDRIKDLIKLIAAKLIGDNYDQRREISIPGKANSYFAEMREKVTIMGKKDLPKDIYSSRESGHRFRHEEEAKETVVHYSKNMTIDWSILKRELSPILNEIKEIYRFNLNDFLIYLDDANRVMPIFDENLKEVIKLKLPKVYHFNMIFAITPYRTKKKMDLSKKEIFRIRVVVDKKGIKRVENINDFPVPRVIHQCSNLPERPKTHLSPHTSSQSLIEQH